MEFVAAILVSAMVSALVTNALCRKHLDTVDRMTQSAVDEMQKIGKEIADQAHSVIEESRRR